MTSLKHHGHKISWFVWLVRPYEVVLPVELPIVHEITAVLREWGRIWRDLYMASILHKACHFMMIMMMIINDHRWSFGLTLGVQLKLDRVYSLWFVMIDAYSVHFKERMLSGFMVDRYLIGNEVAATYFIMNFSVWWTGALVRRVITLVPGSFFTKSSVAN